MHPLNDYNDYRCVREILVDEEHGLLRKCVLYECSNLENEYNALNKLFDAQVPVPKPLSYELVDGYEVLDMEYIQGKTLEERLEDIECEEAKMHFAEEIAEKVVDILTQVQNFTHHEVCGVRKEEPVMGTCFDRPLALHEYLQHLLRLYTISPALERKFMELTTDEGTVLAHGEICYAPNVFITERGDVIVLGWKRAGYYFKDFDAWMVSQIHINSPGVWTSALMKKMNVPPNIFKMAEIMEALWQYGVGDPDLTIREKREAMWWPLVQEAVGEDLGDPVGEVDFEALNPRLYADFWRDMVTTTGDLSEDTPSESGLEETWKG